MSTFLSKLFKPKWQSKNPAIRLQAIAALDPLTVEAQRILQSLASSDPELQVRHQAIIALNDPSFLLTLHQQSDTPTRVLIEQRLPALAQKLSLTLFDLTQDAALLSRIIIASPTPEQYLSGLAQIEDAAALSTIAMQARTSRMRQAAADLLESEQHLSQVQQASKGKDKQVYRIVKDKLTQLRAQQQAAQEQRSQLARLTQQLQELVHTENMLHYEARLSALEQRWQPLRDSAESTQQAQIEKLLQDCHQRWRAMLDLQHANAEKQAQESAGSLEHTATLQTLEDAIQRFQQQSASTRDLPALDALLKTQQTRWEEALTQHQPDTPQSQRYQRLLQQLQQYHAALRQVQEQQGEITRLCQEIAQQSPGSAQLKPLFQSLHQVAHSIHWPNDFPAPALLEQLQQTLGQANELRQLEAKQVRQLQQQLEQTLAQLDQHLEARLLKASNECYRQVQHFMDQLGPEQGARYHAGINLRFKQLTELREWQGFASLPRQQELAEAMEHLADASIEPGLKQEKIKAMQREWKALGGSREPELWQRFKAASDRAYAPVRQWQEEQARLRAANLAKRQTLIQQLHAFIEGNDWSHADWKAVEQISKQARQDWKEAWPVNQREQGKLQEQFNQQLKRLDTLLLEERKRNEGLKQQIVSQAQALADEADLGRAIEQAKALQHAWQQVGVTRFHQDRKLWQSFRAACDAVFARRDHAREQRQAEVSQALAQAESLLEEMQQSLAELPTMAAQQIEALQQDFRRRSKQLPELAGNQQEAMRKRFDEYLQTMRQAQLTRRNQQVMQQWQEALRKSAVCHSLARTPSAATALHADFASRCPLPEALEQTLDTLWQTLATQPLSPEHRLDAESCRDLLIKCEIAAGLPSPASEQTRRMQLQVNRLSEGFAGAGEATSREQQLFTLLLAWCSKAGLSETELNAALQRWQACLVQLLGSSQTTQH